MMTLLGFDKISNVINIIGASYKRRDSLREKQAEKVEKALRMGEIRSERGLNQELGQKRPGDTRWGSHYRSLLNLGKLFSSIIDVLDALSTVFYEDC